MNRSFRHMGAVLVAAAVSGPAAALDYELGDGIYLKMLNKVTLGAGIRTQGRHIDDLGILNTPGQQGSCYLTDCLSFAGDPSVNQEFIALRGGFFLHAADDGDMNYDKYDPYTALSKLSSDWTLNWGEWTFKTNFTAFFDAVNAGFTTRRFNTVRCTGTNPSAVCTDAADGRDEYLLGESERARTGEIENRLAVRGEFREYFVTRTFMLGDYEIFATLGNQRLRWGEANLTLLNTLDVINPQDAVLARQPGLALNELNLPTGLLSGGADVLDGVTLDGWLQYDWEPVRPEPSGSMFANLSDVAGGGTFAVVGLGQYPEDPDALWFSRGTSGLISNSHRSIQVPDEKTHAPDDFGQYGIRVKWFLPDFNNGTELGFYFANYHSRLPYASVTAARDSCLRDAANMAQAATMCQGFNAASNRGQAAPLAPERCDPRGCDPAAYLAREPLPIDTMGLFLEFPENIRMFGLSFNTTAGGWSFAGEYAYRPNLPAQVLLSDVVFAATTPAVPRQSFAFTGIGAFNPVLATPEAGLRVTELLADFASQGDPSASSAALPSADIIFPCYICAYRGYDNGSAATDINGGQYFSGYERLKVGQFALTALQLFSTNPFGSDDLLMVYEIGFTHVVDMPQGIYFQGAGDLTHPSPGADCTGFPAGTDCTSTDVVGRINPTQQTEGFADDFAWGLRTLWQLNYSNLFDAGLTMKPTVLAFWDVEGIAPSPMQNYVEDSRWVVPALFFEYGDSVSASVIYQYFAGSRNSLSGRDNLAVSLSYAF